MFAKITKIEIVAKRMIAIFYYSDKRPVKTVHFRAAGYPDYTISSHDDERNTRNIKRHTKTGTTIRQQALYQDIYYGKYRLEHCC